MFTIFELGYILLVLGNAFISTESAISDIIESTLSGAFNRSKIRPLWDEGLNLVITVSIDIDEITSLKETDQEYTLICFLRLNWKDERLAYSGYNKSIPLHPNEFARIWTPDIIVKNMKRGFLHDVTMPNRQIRISPDGTVLFSQRISLTLICRMKLQMYPMDNQTCPIEFTSYGYGSEHITLNWDESQHRPIKVDVHLVLQEFIIVDMGRETCFTEFLKTGNFSCLKAFFHFKRRINVYMLNLYLPSTMVVILSWLSFWIDPESTPARTSLSILPVLTITSQSAALTRRAPSGPVTKASDIWIATCLVFVFAAFLEYNIVNSMIKKLKKPQVTSLGSESSWTDPALVLENICKIAFPVLFLLFNIVYWAYHLAIYSRN